MRAIASLVAALAVLIVVGVSAAPASAAPVAGGLEVRLTTDTDVPLHLGSVGIQAMSGSGAGGSGYTSSDGVATIGQLYGPLTFTVSTFDIPDQGSATFAPAEIDDVTVTPGATTVVRLALHVGATVSGAVVGPTNAALAGVTITAYQQSRPSAIAEATTDASGRYTLDGLATGVDTIEGSVTPAGYATSWKTQVFQQRGPIPATHVQLSTHLLHSTYDAAIGATTSDGSVNPSLSGATVRLVGADTSAVVATERFSTIPDSAQEAEFVVPSGSYRAQLLVPGGTYWLDQDGLTTRWVADEADATELRLVYGWLQGWTGVAP